MTARVLVVIGAVALLAGAMFAWASPTLFDSDKFAARARQSLDDSPALRRVVARTLVINVVEAQKADLIAFRPLLITAGEAVVNTDAFGDVFELAARHAHELFTDEPGGNVVLRANEAALCTRSSTSCTARSSPRTVQAKSRGSMRSPIKRHRSRAAADMYAVQHADASPSSASVQSPPPGPVNAT